MSALAWQVKLGVEAERDFEKIIRNTRDTFGPKQAKIYAEGIAIALETLGSGPAVVGSKARNDIRHGLRSLHLARQGRRARHLLIYRAASDTQIDVLRILHDAVDIARHVPLTR